MWKSALKWLGKWYCNACYVTLGTGRGARPIGWLSGTEECKTCSKCGDSCYYVDSDI